MIYIYKTKMEAHPEIAGKLRPTKDAGDCHKLIESKICLCEGSDKIQFNKEGCKTMTFKTVKYIDGIPATQEQLEAIRSNPYLALFERTKVEEVQEIESEVLDPTPLKVEFSTDCVKPDGTPITLADFPENHSFGNGVTVGASIRIRDVGVMILSWCCFCDDDIAKVKAKKVQLEAIMV